MLFEAMFMMASWYFFSTFHLKLANLIANNSSKFYCGLVEVHKGEDFTPVSSKAKE